jgi:hypothetical protein
MPVTFMRSIKYGSTSESLNLLDSWLNVYYSALQRWFLKHTGWIPFLHPPHIVLDLFLLSLVEHTIQFRPDTHVVMKLSRESDLLGKLTWTIWCLEFTTITANESMWKRIAINIFHCMLLNAYFLYRRNTDDDQLLSRADFIASVIEALNRFIKFIGFMIKRLLFCSTAMISQTYRMNTLSASFTYWPRSFSVYSYNL